MMSEEELVNLAFNELGGLLSTHENAREVAATIMMYRYNLDDSIADEVVAIAFERWVEVYCPD